MLGNPYYFTDFPYFVPNVATFQKNATCAVETQRTQRTQRNNDEKSVYQEMPRHFPDRLRDENNGVSPLCRGFTTNGTRHRLLL